MTDLSHSVVRIWHGVPGEAGATPRGTGVIIAPGLVMTARHVITETPGHASQPRQIPKERINLTSDFGAFVRGGPQGVREPILPPDPDVDLALLPLLFPSPIAQCAEIAAQEPDLRDSPEVRFCAYAQPGKGVDPKTAHICSYAGAWHRYVLDVEPQPGNSGGPVYWRGRLIGIVTTMLEGETLVQPLDEPVRDFIRRNIVQDPVYQRISITSWHVQELMGLLAGLPEPVPPDVVAELFPRAAKEVTLPETTADRSPFGRCLAYLAQRYNGPSEAPFLVFLAACRKRADLDHRLSAEDLDALERWQEAARERVAMAPETLAVQVRAVLEPPQDRRPAILFIKIEPNLLDPDQTWYFLHSWLGYWERVTEGDRPCDEHLHFDPLELPPLREDEHQSPRHGMDRVALVEGVCTAVKAGRRKLYKERLTKTLHVELVLPQSLFDWNPKAVETRPDKSLLASYPVVLRSWERNYPWWEDPFGGEGDPDDWEKKCTALPAHRLMPHHVWREEVAQEGDDLNRKLRGEVWALIAPCLEGERKERARRVLLAGLCEGLPFILWPLISNLEGRDKHETLLQWLVATRHQDWPELMYGARCEDHPDWLDLALLWDDPRHPAPGRDYSFDLTD